MVLRLLTCAPGRIVLWLRKRRMWEEQVSWDNLGCSLLCGGCIGFAGSPVERQLGPTGGPGLGGLGG